MPQTETAADHVSFKMVDSAEVGVAPTPGLYRLPLLRWRRETPTVLTFQFGIEGSGFRYLPNQFIFLELPGVQDPRGSRRPYSLSSSPTETEAISVTSKMTSSPFKERLASLREGENAIVRGPFGDFLLEPSRPAVMIAGGVGITPFRGMIRYAADSDLSIPIALLYSNTIPEEIAFRRELQDIEKGWGGLTVVHTLTRPKESTTSWSGRTGRIDAKLIREALDEMKNPVVYVCGSPGFVGGVVGILRQEIGFPSERLRIERFRGY